MAGSYLMRFYGGREQRRQVDFESYLYREMRSHGLGCLTAPIAVGLKITDRCNFQCRFCFSKAGVGKDLSASEVRFILDESLPAKPRRVYITGGEPFISSEALDVIECIKGRNIAVSVHTNASLITPELARELSLLLRETDWIQTSLDGHTAVLFSLVRNGADFDATAEGIQNLVGSGIAVRTNTVVSNHNLDHLDGIYRLAASLGVKEVSFSPLLELNRNDDFSLPPDISVLRSFSRVLKLHYQSGQRLSIGQNPVAVPWGNRQLKHIYRDRPLICPAARTAVEIDPAGVVYPCPFLHRTEFAMGNVLTDDWSSIWGDAQNKVSPFRHPDWTSSVVCRSCQNYEQCRGGCMAAAFIHGTQCDPRCEYARGHQ